MADNQDIQFDEEVYEGENNAPEKSSKDKYIIIGAIVVALIVCVVMFMAKRSKNKPADTEVVVEQVAQQPVQPVQPYTDPNQLQTLQQPLQPTQMIDVPTNMPKSTDPVSGKITIKDSTGRDVDPYTYEGQQVIVQHNAANGLQPIYVPNTPAPVNPNSPVGQAQLAQQATNNQLNQVEAENSRLKAQINSLRDVAQRQHITIGQLQTLIKNTRANQGSNIVTLRSTKSGVSVNKALPQGYEVVATVGNRVWLSDGRDTTSYAIGQKLPTGYSVLDVNETAGEVSFSK
ncbi:hypothetical protein [Acinetobacter sp. Marseille-Q1618]|uniref:hypothetical protein n=1 Tax=Acinetobacter sp. Marseille-Q1618 TaxID=2697502 RepID=UPI00156F5F0F|nr:hypothetical protein [Acinetobacter sp. Marseille-Q1618]